MEALSASALGRGASPRRSRREPAHFALCATPRGHRLRGQRADGRGASRADRVRARAPGCRGGLFGNNHGDGVDVAEAMVDGEILREGRQDEGLARRARAWSARRRCAKTSRRMIIPVRHAPGAALMTAAAIGRPSRSSARTCASGPTTAGRLRPCAHPPASGRPPRRSRSRPALARVGKADIELTSSCLACPAPERGARGRASWPRVTLPVRRAWRSGRAGRSALFPNSRTAPRSDAPPRSPRRVSPRSAPAGQDNSPPAGLAAGRVCTGHERPLVIVGVRRVSAG